jgi:hypothetical protein
MNPQQPGQPVSYNSNDSGTGGGAKNLIIIVLLAVLLAASLGFGGWAYSQMLSYKNDTNKKIDSAVAAAKSAQAKEVQDAFDKANTTQFQGSSTYGSVSFSYPKTWSAYVDTSSSSEPISAYFHPDQVNGVSSRSAYSLRVELISGDYSQALQQFSGFIKQGTVTSKAYLPPKLNGVSNAQPGTLLSGQINTSDSTQRGEMLIIRVRDKTLKISSQSNDYLNDFNNIILTSLTFAP